MEDKIYKGDDRNHNGIWIRLNDDKRCCSQTNCLNVYRGHGLCDTHLRHAIKRNEISFNKTYNTYTETDDYIEVTVNNKNYIYKIDKEFLEYGKQHNWYSSMRIINGNEYPYLVAKVTKNGKSTVLKFHVEIMSREIEKFKKENNYNKKIIVDHKNGDVKDNRKSNLRVRTQSENNMNKEMQSNNTSGVVGVSWNAQHKIWQAYIGCKGETKVIGLFYYMRNAVKARIKAEEELFGEHALRKRENNDYDAYINHMLSLPDIKEPVLRDRPQNEFGVLGIRRKSNGKYESYIYIQDEYKTKTKTFDNLNEAIAWRKEKEREIYGQEVTYNDEKEDKLI